MKSWFGCASFVVLLIMGACVFGIAQRVHQTQLNIQILKRENAQEQDRLRVLQAEWTYLNNPDRLEKLAATFGLQPLDGKQYVAINNVPTQKAMKAIEIAQKTDTTAQQQLAAANTPVDEQKVDRALALAAAHQTATAMPTAMPTSLDMTLTDNGVE